ncbi:MAG TPA: LpqB family beta-propeller domain-containing protein, partial [Jatrophihabitans sp.]|nr:LpqB family beta-propeller domain-containing protein [Jatrophihabitans sp.]
DVAWLEDTKLLVIGAAAGSNGGAAQVWRLASDGAKLDAIPNGLLPPGPLTAIAARNGQTLVSASGSIWARATETTQDWSPYPATKPSTQGTNPIFAE